jgi:hypothetical protein
LSVLSILRIPDRRVLARRESNNRTRAAGQIVINRKTIRRAGLTAGNYEFVVPAVVDDCRDDA